MLLERYFEMWELGAFFDAYYRRVLNQEPPAEPRPPAEALDGLEMGTALIERPARGETPTGLATWTLKGSEAVLDFVYTLAEAQDRDRPRGAELILGAWTAIAGRAGIKSLSTNFTRRLSAVGEDFISPLAARLGMERRDDVFLVRSLAGEICDDGFPAGIRKASWSDAMLDQAIRVMMAAPDPGRLDEWNEQLCRDEILWAAAGHPRGFGDGRAVCAFKGERLVGFALAAQGALISEVHVAPEFQNKGLGTALLAELLRRLQRAGHDEASAVIGELNGEALRLFERLGFSEDIRFPSWSWCRQPLNLSGVELRWDTRVLREEVVNIFLRAGSPLAFEPRRLVEGFRKSRFRLEARQRGELLGIARGVGDSSTNLFVCDLIVDPKYRRRGLGTMMAKAISERFRTIPRLLFCCAESPQGVLQGLGMKELRGTYKPRSDTRRRP